MIGRVIFSEPGFVATLEDDGRWTCAGDEQLEWFLNAAFSLRDVSPGAGVPGWALLDRVAAKLGAASVEKVVKPSPKSPDGLPVVY